MEIKQGLKPGATLHHGIYRIERVLGQGGFGLTYLATDLTLDRKVAVKEFFPKDYCDRISDTSHVTLGTSSTEGFVKKLKARFLKEARNIAKLDNPGIIRIYAAFEENNTAYYIMEYIEGANLSEIVKRDGPMPADKALRYIRKVGEALGFIHSNFMNHFDVKPANIMVREADGEPVLIDFGLSKQYDPDGNATTSTAIAGVSAGYTPVEQYHRGGMGGFSPQTDLYSLAATLYYLLSGENPPESISIIGKPVPMPPSIPSGLVAPIRKAMSPVLTDRHESIREFLDGLSLENNDAVSSPAETTAEGSETPGGNADTEIKPNYNPEPQSEPSPEIPAETVGTDDSSGKSSRRMLLWVVGLVAVVIVAVGVALWPHPGKVEAAKSDDEVVEYPEGSQPDIDSLNISKMVENGNTAYDSKNYQEALRWYSRAADEGNAEAQYRLGRMYRLGQGVGQNDTLAAKWYRDAADSGNANAQFYLGRMYAEGEGVERDYVKAASLYTKSAEQGNTDAQYNLGWLYRNGYGVEKDDDKALDWYLRSAEQGNANAQNSMGLMYEKGYSVDRDYSEALRWYRMSAEQGNSTAQANIGFMYQNGYGVAKDSEEAVRWYRRSADGGNARGQYRLGCMYYYGEGIKQNFKEAKKWWEKSAAQGDKEAKAKLSNMR